MSCFGSTDDFFCVTASSHIPVADFLFKYPYNPPVYPSSVVPCHSAPLRAVHWPVTLAHYLVHLGNVIRRTRLLHSPRSSLTLQRVPINYSSSLIVAWKSRHTRVVLLGLASCRALPRLLDQLTEHPAQRLGLVLDLPAL